MRIEDYALIGDTQTAALVGADGSIDWLCLPRFDSAACFAALVGTPENGYWRIAPADAERASSRRYRGESLVLETTFETAGGTVRVVDCMPPRARDPDLVRVVEGVAGTVSMRMELAIRFDYGRSIPWVRRVDGRVTAVGGPDALVLDTPVATFGEGFRTVAEFEVSAGEQVPFVLEWHPSHEPPDATIDGVSQVEDTRSVVGGMVRTVHPRWSVARRRRSIVDHVEGADVRADGRDRRRADDVAARAARRRS